MTPYGEQIFTQITASSKVLLKYVNRASFLVLDCFVNIGLLMLLATYRRHRKGFRTRPMNYPFADVFISLRWQTGDNWSGQGVMTANEGQ